MRGYYDCAFTTFVDVIYKDIQAELFTICRNELGAALKERIGLEAEDGMLRSLCPSIMLMSSKQSNAAPYCWRSTQKRREPASNS